MRDAMLVDGEEVEVEVEGREGGRERVKQNKENPQKAQGELIGYQ